MDVVLNMDLFSTSQARLYFIINHWAKPIWPSKKTRKDWVSRDTQRSRLHLSVPFTDHVVLLDCLNWHCVAFTLCCRNAHWQKAIFFSLKASDIFAPRFVSGYAAHSAVNDLALITRRASHQPFGSVSCTCSSSMYLLSVMLLSWYLCAFLLCPSPSVACCSDSMVLFPLLAPV